MYTSVSIFLYFSICNDLKNARLQVIFAFALFAFAHARPSYDDGIILKGPSGIITKDGPIGPNGPATGGSDEGKYDDGSYPGDKEYESPAPAYYAPPAPAPVYYAPPAPVYYAPAPAYYAPAPAPVKGVAVQGPKTVPALIEGPVGKIFADGLYSPPAPKKYY